MTSIIYACTIHTAAFNICDVIQDSAKNQLHSIQLSYPLLRLSCLDRHRTHDYADKTHKEICVYEVKQLLTV